MNRMYAEPITKAQAQSLKRLWLRNPDGHLSFLSFRRTVRHDFLIGVVFVPWCGMMVGIEKDGYSHT